MELSLSAGDEVAGRNETAGIRKDGRSLQWGEGIQKGCIRGKTGENGEECSEVNGGTQKVQVLLWKEGIQGFHCSVSIYERG